MPLSILLPLVVGGIAGIVILLHLLGLSRQLIIADEQTALAAWNDEFGNDAAISATTCHDGHAALISTASGGQGIVFSMGADTTARYLAGAQVARTPRGLRVDLPDFTAPHIYLTLEPVEAARWQPIIGEIA
ncbi:hypothetical protein RXV86_01920 [Alisedimentitalea sp. MJ-SS2]|uniref:hypothetical protein n=1 Tax=Aliisedimentitalea sp. MJ-SS2 TaxID=3049795 RepID=UPI00290EA1A7|nr:hypothetical protein [Alisedimentitalea sp. MJ-SS2]MDU8926133.1 hypothetical protein [Alisedimentitalea sp. MJ-SS2]